MQDKDNQKRLCKLLVLAELLVQEIDHPTMGKTKEAISIQQKAEALQEDLLPIIDSYYTQPELSRSNLSQIMQRKFEYIFDKTYKS